MKPLRVQATGLVTSLGQGAATACAAARAGLVRSGPVEYPVWSPDDGGAGKAVAHQGVGVEFGYEGEARIYQLVLLALRDLAKQLGRVSAANATLSCCLAITDPWRESRGARLPGGDPTNRSEAEAAESQLSQDLALEPYALLVRTASKEAGFGRVDLMSVSTSDHSAVAESIGFASNYLQQSGDESVLVLAVDSFLDEDCLAWLESTGRLKAPDMPVGLQPGEAGVAILLSRSNPNPTTRRDLQVSAVGFAQESEAMLSGGSPTGLGLLEAIQDCLRSAADGNDKPKDCWVIQGLNGEYYRSQDWGLALHRAARMMPHIASAPAWYPAASFGETGAAFGGVAVAWAFQAFARDYAPARRCFVVGASDGPTRSAILLECVTS